MQDASHNACVLFRVYKPQLTANCIVLVFTLHAIEYKNTVLLYCPAKFAQKNKISTNEGNRMKRD